MNNYWFWRTIRTIEQWQVKQRSGLRVYLEQWDSLKNEILIVQGIN